MKTTQMKDQDTTHKLDSQQNLTPEHDEQASLQDVAEIAYFKAESRGFAPGYELDDWLEAEQELNLS
jgi:hypothetical protein